MKKQALTILTAVLLSSAVGQASRLFTSGFETRNITETECLSTGTTISFVGLNHSGKSAKEASA